MNKVAFALTIQTRTANMEGTLRGEVLNDLFKADLLKKLGQLFVVAETAAEAPIEACFRCGRVPSDLIHDNPNDHGWTGTMAMHPFVDARGKDLLQRTAWNVAMEGKSRGKGRRLTDDKVKWNEAIARAKRAVAEMFAPLTSEEIAAHDRYFAAEYVKAWVGAEPSPADKET